jgi:hypothetical protein
MKIEQPVAGWAFRSSQCLKGPLNQAVLGRRSWGAQFRGWGEIGSTCGRPSLLLIAWAAAVGLIATHVLAHTAALLLTHLVKFLLLIFVQHVLDL